MTIRPGPYTADHLPGGPSVIVDGQASIMAEVYDQDSAEFLAMAPEMFELLERLVDPQSPSSLPIRYCLNAAEALVKRVRGTP